MKDILYFNTLDDIRIVNTLRTNNKEKALPNQIILTIQSAGAGQITPVFLKDNGEVSFTSIDEIGTKFILDGKEITSDKFQIIDGKLFHFGLQFKDSNKHTLKVSLVNSTINQNTFEGNRHLIKVTIGTSITSIGSNAFSGCGGLTTITIPNSITSIGNECFMGSNLTSVTIPNSVTSIPYRCFYDCSNLTSITIPNSVTEIGESAFKNCTSLITITSLAMIAPIISSNTFQNIKTNGTLHVPAGSNYSTWMSTSNYYLGLYNWTKLKLKTLK